MSEASKVICETCPLLSDYDDGTYCILGYITRYMEIGEDLVTISDECKLKSVRFDDDNEFRPVLREDK